MSQSATKRYEIGPIRPPSEAASLMLRVTRNCSWNRCKFCTLYKGQKFSMRSEQEIVADIDTIHAAVELLRNREAQNGYLPSLQQLAREASLQGRFDLQALASAYQWYSNGMESVFLQDGNSIIIKPAEMLNILRHLKRCFPEIKRITTYARSRNLAKMKDEDLKAMADLGLNRIHIGMETGADSVLTLVNKGTTKAFHIQGGQKVKKAGMQLSVYYMPGLGGVALSEENARETADAINQINPDFIRIRTLAVTESSGLHEEIEKGNFEQMSDPQMVGELYRFIDSLDGIESVVKSDHILNLLQDVEGRLPEDKQSMLAKLQRFIDLSQQDQLLYMAGRRAGVYSSLDDMEDSYLTHHANDVIARNGLTEENIDSFTRQMMTRFI